MKIYKLNRDVGEYKKGMTIDTNKVRIEYLENMTLVSFETNQYIEKKGICIFYEVLQTWLALGWLDEVVEDGKWKPKYGEPIYKIYSNGSVKKEVFVINCDERYLEFGSIFPTRELAEKKRDEVKELLNKK